MSYQVSVLVDERVSKPVRRRVLDTRGEAPLLGLDGRSVAMCSAFVEG